MTFVLFFFFVFFLDGEAKNSVLVGPSGETVYETN
jgi:hypothetical protein